MLAKLTKTHIALLPLVCGLLFLPNVSKANDADTEFFENRVRPVLVERCYSCHSGTEPKGGLRLDSREGFLKGGKRGTALNLTMPNESLFLKAVRYEGEVRMPPNGPIPPAEVAALAEWVKRGGKWSAQKAMPKGKTPAKPKPHWSFQVVKRPSRPKVIRKEWVRNPIDAFILASLEAKGLTPAPEADRRTLLRRAAFDLLGLPPTPEELDAFLNDKSPKAWERAIDRLLASPQYGVRWGRHWLDVARYADSADARGSGSEGDISEAWRYRDWVIDAFNRDMPYDRFVMNQIAGDLLPPENGEKDDLNVAGTIATTLLAIGNWGNGDADKDKILTDIADDQLDIVGRGFMGLTIACARCHDHKFDPISTEDYYGMAGIFFSTHILPKLTPKGAGEVPLRIPLETKELRQRREAYTKSVAEFEKKIAEQRGNLRQKLAEQLQPETAKYVFAVWDYANRPTDRADETLQAYAKREGLRLFALRQWRDALGIGEYRQMTKPIADLLGNKNIVGLAGVSDPPSMVVNLNPDAKTILTFTLPGRSVSVHPGPRSGVAVGWQSPIQGDVEVSGRVIDADGACGNGIAWAIDHRKRLGASQLASGAFANGGNQSFQDGKDSANLKKVKVLRGERLELLVLPNPEYSCDTTVVEWTIKEIASGKVWNLTQDVLQNPPIGGRNLIPDQYGNDGVWRFYDTVETDRGGAQAFAPDSAPSKLLVALSAASSDQMQVAAAQFARDFVPTAQFNPFLMRQDSDEAEFQGEGAEALRNQVAELQRLRANPPPPIQFANGAAEGGVPESPHAGTRDVRVHVRGNYARLGEVVPRRFPTVLAGNSQPRITKGSGRLELAQWLVKPNHPLTARVMVNRIWLAHFGQGIVRTPSNFGALGERPTHPALLDWLASEFVRSGWSLKQMHRLMMTSATYRQSSVAPIPTQKRDPDNRLWGRMERRRLEAEAIRDNLLAVAGNLDLTMGGMAYRDFNTPRRTAYLITIRSEWSGFGPLFDAADPTATVERRITSTVAPQALFLLNNPFVAAQSNTLANRLLQSAPNDTTRIQQAYRLLYSRSPRTEEIKIGLSYLSRIRANGGDKSPQELAAWKAYAHLLLCANEFLYVD